MAIQKVNISVCKIKNCLFQAQSFVNLQLDITKSCFYEQN